MFRVSSWLKDVVPCGLACLAEAKQRASYFALLSARCHFGLPDCICGMSCADLWTVSVAPRL